MTAVVEPLLRSNNDDDDDDDDDDADATQDSRGFGLTAETQSPIPRFRCKKYHKVFSVVSR